MASRVRSHSRRGYYRKDGTYVRPTTVSAHFRNSSHRHHANTPTCKSSAYIPGSYRQREDKVTRAGKTVYRHLIDDEWAWQILYNGDWITVWRGIEPPTPADLEVFLRIYRETASLLNSYSLRNDSARYVMEVKSYSDYENNHCIYMSNPSNTILLRFFWDYYYNGCLKVSIRDASDRPKACFRWRFSTEGADDLHDFCSIVAG